MLSLIWNSLVLAAEQSDEIDNPWEALVIVAPLAFIAFFLWIFLRD